MSLQKMESTGCVNMKFIVFLKSTLGKMVAIKTLDQDFINLEFWQTWPRKFYNIKSYDTTKDEFEMENAKMDGNDFNSDSDEDKGEGDSGNNRVDDLGEDAGEGDADNNVEETENEQLHQNDHQHEDVSNNQPINESNVNIFF